MAKGKRIASFFRDSMRVPEILARFHDIRKNPQIPLQNILASILLMPFWGATSLLSLDRLSRKRRVKGLFNCRRKMVASDSTIARVLRWLDATVVEEVLQGLWQRLEPLGCLQRHLVPNRRRRRIGIIDGSYMGGHYHVTATLLGEIDYPVCVEPCSGRGKELPTAYRILEELPAKLGPCAPELWLFDGLYITANTFKRVHDQRAHLLVKCGDNPEFRDILVDAQALFSHPSRAVEKVEETSGIDGERQCCWSMKKTSGEFAGYPVHIFFLSEDYLKRKKNSHVEAWIVTTDLTLTAAEVREASHLRWHIENQVFKRLSHLCGTKRFYFKDPRRFFTLLRLICLAMTLFDAFFTIMRRDAEGFKRLRGGIKPTWKNLCSQVEEALPPKFARAIAFD